MDDSPRASGNLTFPKTHRLLKRPEFLGVMRNGARRFSASFIFFLQPSERVHTRIGVTVSKKVGNAVTRNRVKRLVREAFRLHPELFATPLDVVVVAKRQLRVRGLADVVKEFQYVLRRYHRERPGPGRTRSDRG